MRVLLVIRDDAQKTLGGDTIQLYKTKEQLEQLGCVAEARAASEVESPERYDIAHVFNIQTFESSWAAMETLLKKGVPTVLSSIYWDMLDHWFEFAVHDKALWRALARGMGPRAARGVYVAWQRRKAPRTREWQLQRRLLEGARRVLPNSHSEAELLQATFNLNGTFHDKVDVVPNGIDPAQYDPLPAPSEWFRQQYGLRDFVIEVGRISPVKNQIGVIEALWDLPVPIVFIGQPEPAAPEYAERCKALGARRGNVIFIDRLPHAELPGVYALAKVHVLPSWRETPGLVSLEAAAAGCNIVTTSIGSTRDYFGEHAWYCYPDDRAAIRRGVEAALAAPQSGEREAPKLGEAQRRASPAQAQLAPAPRQTQLRERILREFTWRKAAEATLASYHKALQWLSPSTRSAQSR